MRYWIIIDNRQHGPLTAGEISAMGCLRRDTPVWHEGLPSWVQAGDVAELAALLVPPAAPPVAAAAPTAPVAVCDGSAGAGAMWNAAAPAAARGWAQAPLRNVEPEPESFLLWAILTTILCCIPTGIVAIVMSSRVSGRYARGDYEGARRASRAAELWVVVTITLGLVTMPFQMIMAML